MPTSSDKLIYSYSFFWQVIPQLPLWHGEEASMHPCKASLMWTKRQPKRKGQKCVHHVWAQSVSIIGYRKYVHSGSRPSPCACLAIVKNHSRVLGIIIPFSKSCHEAGQWDDIHKEPSTQHVVDIPYMLLIIIIIFLIAIRVCMQFREKVFLF